MRCKPNQLCFIKKALRPVNIGRVVTTVTHLGYYSKGESMKITVSGYPEIMVAYDSDDYWIVTSSSANLENFYGKTDTLVIMDSWLTPILPDELEETNENLLYNELTELV